MSAKMTDLEAEIQLLRRLQPKSTLPSKSATQHLIQVFLNGPGRCMPDCVDVNGLRYNAPNLTLHAIVVLSLTLLETPYTALGLEESAEIYINRCTEYIYSKIMYETTLDSITALLILSFGVLLEGKGPSQWSVISLLTGTVNFVNLGAERKASNDTSRIHYLPTPVLPMASSEEMKRRQMIFWSSFCMESLICYATGWTVKTLKENKQDPPEQNGSFCALIEVLKIGNRIHELLTEDVDLRCEEELKAWSRQHSLLSDYLALVQPCRLTFESMDTIDMMLFGMYHAVVIRHHSPNVHTTNAFVIASTKSRSEAVCRESIYMLARYADHLNRRIAEHTSVEEVMSISNIYVAFSIWVAGRNFFFFESQMPIEFYNIVKALKNMQRCCKLAGVYADVLERVNFSIDPRYTASEVLSIRRTTFEILRTEGLKDTPTDKWQEQIKLLLEPVFTDSLDSDRTFPLF